MTSTVQSDTVAVERICHLSTFVPIYIVVCQSIELEDHFWHQITDVHKYLRPSLKKVVSSPDNVLFCSLRFFYIANCLYIIFFIFLISLQFASKFNLSVIKMLKLLRFFLPDVCRGFTPVAQWGLPSPPPITCHIILKTLSHPG